MRKHIPNLFTLLNLACGSVAVVFALEGQWRWAVYLMLVSAVFDFLDGFAARLLGAGSDTGKQLDSLADMVTFGILPAVMVYAIFRQEFRLEGGMEVPVALQWIMQGGILLIPILSAIRLARFNVRAGDSEFFSGLPTPAHALFWAGLYWQIMQSETLFGHHINPFFLWTVMLIMGFYMIVPLPMISLKFSNFRIRGNLIRYLLLLISALILGFTGISGLTLVVLCYILLSLLNLLLQLRVSS